MILNIASYKFITLNETALPRLQQTLKAQALQCEIKGTILLSHEGINLILAGEVDAIRTYQSYLAQFYEFQDLTYKESYSQTVPFIRMLVRLKKEIIALGVPEIKPEQKTAPYISPQELKRRYDEQQDMVIIDTRNDYEVMIGAFENAINLNIETFRDFPDSIKKLPDEIKTKPVITYCTGGIRCEKAAALLLEQGFQEVYQLQGGILNYFEKCGSDHYQGECFVFDDRIALDAELNETGTKLCDNCQMPLTVVQQKNPSCCHCQSNINSLPLSQVLRGEGGGEGT